MIKINPNPEFTEDIEITVPGQKETGTIQLTFKYRNRKEYIEWIGGFGGEKSSKKKDAEPRKHTDIFCDFVVGWGIDDEFNKKNVDIFLANYPAAFDEIIRAYARLLFESRVKN